MISVLKQIRNNELIQSIVGSKPALIGEIRPALQNAQLKDPYSLSTGNPRPPLESLTTAAAESNLLLVFNPPQLPGLISPPLPLGCANEIRPYHHLIYCLRGSACASLSHAISSYPACRFNCAGSQVEVCLFSCVGFKARDEALRPTNHRIESRFKLSGSGTAVAFVSSAFWLQPMYDLENIVYGTFQSELGTYSWIGKVACMQRSLLDLRYIKLTSNRNRRNLSTSS